MGIKKEHSVAPFITDRSIGGVNFCTTDENYWRGCEAAFIKSKKQSVKQESLPNHFNLLFPEKDAGIIVESMAPIGEEAPGLESDKLSYNNFWYPYNPDAEHKSTAAELVARVTELVRSSIEWESFPPTTHGILSENLDSIIIKLVLSLLDMDDVVYAMKPENRDYGISPLFRKIDLVEELKLSRTDIESMTMRQKWKLMKKIEKKVMNQIAKDSIGSEVFDGFDEECVYKFVKFCVKAVTAPPSEARVYGVLAKYLPTYDHLNTKQVIEELKTFVPLKADFKLQLNLELDFYTKYWHMVDYLFVEACKGVVNQKLLEDLGRVYHHGTPVFALSWFLEMLHRGIYKLYDYKHAMMRAYREAALFPLECGHFGKFADEVVQVVNKADHERRIRGHRFIGVQVLLHCLAFSRVGNHELVKSGISNSSHDKPPERPPYIIYKLAGECAENYDAEKVKLEHLVMAVLCVKEDDPIYLYGWKHIDGLREEKAELKEVVGGNVLKYDSKPIRDYDTLIEAVLAGLELPDIRGGKGKQEQVVWKDPIARKKYVPPHKRWR